MRVLRWVLREALGTSAVLAVVWALPYVVEPSWQLVAIYFVIGASFTLFITTFPTRKSEDWIPWWCVFVLIVIWPYAIMELVVRVIKAIKEPL